MPVIGLRENMQFGVNVAVKRVMDVLLALPSLLQSLFGYDALRSGMMMSPSGVSSMMAMIVAVALLGRQVDARWLVGSGLVVMAIASYARSQMNLEIGPWQVIWPHALVMRGI